MAGGEGRCNRTLYSPFGHYPSKGWAKRSWRGETNNDGGLIKICFMVYPNPHIVLFIHNRYSLWGASVILSPPPPPTCFSAESYENIRPVPIGKQPSVATTGNALLLVDMRREPATCFYLSTGESLRGISGSYTQWAGPIHAKFFHFLIPY